MSQTVYFSIVEQIFKSCHLIVDDYTGKIFTLTGEYHRNVVIQFQYKQSLNEIAQVEKDKSLNKSSMAYDHNLSLGCSNILQPC